MNPNQLIGEIRSRFIKKTHTSWEDDLLFEELIRLDPEQLEELIPIIRSYAYPLYWEQRDGMKYGNLFAIDANLKVQIEGNPNSKYYQSWKLERL